MTAQEASQLRQQIAGLRAALGAERTARLNAHERHEKAIAGLAREVAALRAEMAARATWPNRKVA